MAHCLIFRILLEVTLLRVDNTGVYQMIYQIADSASSQMTLTIAVAAVPGGVFGLVEGGGDVVPNIGMVIASITGGATAAILNDSSSTFTLPANIGGTGTSTNAAIRINRIN